MAERSFQLPDVGEGLTEAEIVTWKVAVGDTVTHQPAARRHRDGEGDRRAPEPLRGHGRRPPRSSPATSSTSARRIITIDTAGGDATSDAQRRRGRAGGVGAHRGPRRLRRGDRGAAPTRRHRRGGGTPPATSTATSAATPTAPPRPAAPSLAPRSTPPVRMLAKSLRVDLATIHGSGRDGLITRADVERAAAAAVRPPRRRCARRRAPCASPVSELAGWDDGSARGAHPGARRPARNGRVHEAERLHRSRTPRHG